MSTRSNRATGVRAALGLPLQLVAGVVVLGLLVLIATRLTGDDATYHARLRHAAGLDAGDDVRVAGITVGKVSAVTTDRDQVDVAFSLDQAPEEIGISSGSTVEVKLLSILGQRYLSLAPATSGEELGDGDTLPVSQALDTYTMDQFWLESVPVVQDLDLDTLQRAVNVLATDLEVAPEELNRALKGISGVSEMVTTRQDQLHRLLVSTREVTELVLEQTEELDTVLTSGAQVLSMVDERREILATLLDQAHRLVTGLTEVIRESEPDLVPALKDMRSVLSEIDEHRAAIEETLTYAGPTMRVFTNSAGDGPWLGVNSPNAVFSDDFFCTLTGLFEDCQ